MVAKKNIEIVPYDPQWPQLFEKEAAVIKQALGDNCLEIHHIGSTSVPGLAAKPILDSILVVKDPLLAKKSFISIGIFYRGEYNIPLHYGFSKREGIRLNLHMYEEGHPEVELNLKFRDYLRTHPKVRDEYALLKQKLLQDESSFIKDKSAFTNYTLHKGDFIRHVLKEAGFQRLRLLKCNDEAEWKAATYFRDKYFFEPYGIEDPYTWTFNHDQHAHLVLYQGTDIIGYMHIQFWPGDRAAIRMMAIDEDKRHKKAGIFFLIGCEKWLKALEIKSIHVASRASSLNFYSQNGYSPMPFKDPEGHNAALQDIAVGKVL